MLLRCTCYPSLCWRGKATVTARDYDRISCSLASSCVLPALSCPVPALLVTSEEKALATPVAFAQALRASSQEALSSRAHDITR